MRRYGYSSQGGPLRMVDYYGSGSIWSRAAVLDFRAGEMGHSWIILGVSGGSRWGEHGSGQSGERWGKGCLDGAPEHVSWRRGACVVSEG